MRVKLYLDAVLAKRLPSKLQFIRLGVNEFCDRLIVQNESKSEIKKKEDIRRSLRSRQLWRRAIAFVIVNYLGKNKRGCSDRSFVKMQQIFMEEDIVVVSKSRKGIFLLDANTSKILFLWNLIICGVFVIDLFCTPLIIVWPDLLPQLSNGLHALNFAWLVNIGFRCITI
jgi:hypothetical protein